MFEQENIIDIIIAIQYVVTNSKSIENVTNQLTKLSPCLNSDGFNTTYILELLLTTSPLYNITNPKFIENIETIIELSSISDQDSMIDFSIIFEDDSNIPKPIFQLIKFPINKKKKMITQLNKSIEADLNRFNFFVKPSINIGGPELFNAFMKSIIFRVNYEFLDFKFTNQLIDSIKQSKLADLELLDWIKGFYSPLEILTNLVDYNYSLLDYENILSLEEVIEIINSHFEENPNESIIIDKVLIPYFSYIGIDSWNCFNSNILKFGHKCIINTSHSDIVKNYKTLLYLLRNDRFLLAVNSLDSTIKSTFICTILAIIYLCPKAVLQVFVYSKEMLTLLRPLCSKNSLESSFSSKQLIGMSLEEISQSLSVSQRTIDEMLNIISIGEILYSNELSFADIISLENSDRNLQYAQLVKFINNEVTYETSVKKWSLFLHSLYSTFKRTSVFNKISIEELSEIILYKLLELKQFTVAKDQFCMDFNSISKNQYDDIIIKYCWQLFMNAKNCDQKLGSLRDCVDCLQLLNADSYDSIRLSSLIEANSRLLEWKFYLKPGIPVTPKEIFELNDPLAVIRRILELNDKAYMYPGDLFHIVTLLIDGMDVVNDNKLFIDKEKSFDDPSNLLVIKVKLICLEFSSAQDYNYSFNLSFELLALSIKQKYDIDGLFDLISENWFLFFQLSKNEYDDFPEILVLCSKLKLLGKLLLIVPTEFNTSVLEQWQMLNSQKDQMDTDQANNNDSNTTSNHQSNTYSIESSLGDVQARLQRSLKSSAQDLLNTDKSEIGKNIIGWIVGAN